jgi:hypothetical protein
LVTTGWRICSLVQAARAAAAAVRDCSMNL